VVRLRATFIGNRSWFSAAAVLVILGAACGSDSEPPTGRSPTGQPLTGRPVLKPVGSVDGAPLGYVEYLPPGYGDGVARPLLVFLHGGGESGDGSEASLDAVFKLGIPKLIQNDEWPEDRPFVVLMPQYGVDASNDRQLADEIDAFLSFAIDNYDVDEDRLYLTGISCGAIGAWDYLAVNGDDVVAAAVLIAGHAEGAFAKAGCSLGEVPIWVFHGRADSIVPIDFVEDRVAAIQACDPPPEELQLTVYPGVDHNSWSRTYNLSEGHDVYSWLLDHTT
jgi:predicted peptidase